MVVILHLYGVFFACQKFNALVLIFLYAGRGAKCPSLVKKDPFTGARGYAPHLILIGFSGANNPAYMFSIVPGASKK